MNLLIITESTEFLLRKSVIGGDRAMNLLIITESTEFSIRKSVIGSGRTKLTQRYPVRFCIHNLWGSLVVVC